MRERLDTLLVARGLFATRSQAHAAILAGEVSVGGRAADKPGGLVDSGVELAVAERPRYVSRGGDKLSHALGALEVSVDGEEVCDLGSSTGGFVDACCSTAPATWWPSTSVTGCSTTACASTRASPCSNAPTRATSQADRLPYAPSFVTADVSFISLRLALGPVLESARADYRGLVLVKPQFEAGRAQVGKGGVVRDPAIHLQVLTDIATWLEQHGAAMLGACDSGHPGGNVEYFAYFCDARSPLAAGRADPAGAALKAVEAVHG